MHPNINQRLIQKCPNGVWTQETPLQNESCKDLIFDEGTYHYRGMIEAIFGAEETDGHNLNTRFRLKEN